MTEVFGGIRAPSTLGSFLQSFSWGNVRHERRFRRSWLVGLGGREPVAEGVAKAFKAGFHLIAHRVRPVLCRSNTRLHG
jgi:hypothetical protein